MNIDISEPDQAPVVLQADVAFFGHFAIGAFKFVGAAIGILTGRRPPVEVHVHDLFVVERYSNDVVICIQGHGIPLPGWIAGVAGGSLQVVNGTAAMCGGRIASVGVENLNFNARLHRVFKIGPPEKDTTVGFLAVFEFEGQFKVKELLLRVVEILTLEGFAMNTAIINGPAFGVSCRCPVAKGAAVV